MFDCKTNRLDYGTLLCPPSGYRLDQAVATTYSADLGTLLSIPVALVYAQTLEGDLTGARFQLLEAIKRFSKEVTIYHQAGQLHVPSGLNWLHAFLEDALVPILPLDAFTAFHPKIWVLRYVPTDEETRAKNPVRFRVIVLSRNLTFNRRWDVAACLEGEVGEEVKAVNQPLIDFIQWLHGQRAIPKIADFIGQLSRVSFATPDPFESHAFHPIGIPTHPTNPLGSQKARKTLVMSPFLHEAALRQLRANTQSELFLFSERHELEKLPTALLETLTSYHLSDLVVDGESLSAAEEGTTDIQRQHLHAKLFAFENKEETTWFLGSANATQAALVRNFEFMLELKGHTPATRIHRTFKELVCEGDGKGPFESFKPEMGGKDDAEERRREAEFRRFEYALLNSEIRAQVRPAEMGTNFDLHLALHLETVPVRSDLVVTVQPFNTKQKITPRRLETGKVENCVFENLGELELSRFVHFRIESPDGELHHGFLFRIEVEDLPADRLENILKKIIDSRDKFFDYLRFLLAEEITKEDLLAGTGLDGENTNHNSDTEGWYFDLPIYEQLLVAASRSPRKLAEVDEVIRHLSQGTEESECVIPDTFLSFWESFRQAIPTSKEGSGKWSEKC